MNKKIKSNIDTNIYIRDFEKEYDLLKYKLGRWSIWPVLRFMVTIKLDNIPYDKVTSRKLYEYFKKIRYAFGDLIKLIKGIEQKDVLVISYSSNYSEIESGASYDIFFDKLVIRLSSYFKIEHIDNLSFTKARFPKQIEPDMTFSLFDLLVALLSSIFLNKEIKDHAKVFSRLIMNELDLYEYTNKRVKRTFAYYFWSKKVYSWYLKMVNPKVILLLASYGETGLIAAAKELSIKTVEFQHGHVNRYHTGYSWGSYALDYKKSMLIPDEFFVYGDYYKKELQVNGFWDKEIKVVGSSRMDKYRSLVVKKGVPGKMNITLTTSLLARQQTVDFFYDLLKNYQEKLGIVLSVKMHPAESDRDIYLNKLQVFKDVRIIMSHETPSTFELIKGADFHTSVASSCHYEALALGVPTIILPFDQYGFVQDVIDIEGGFVARTAEDFVKIITDVKNFKIDETLANYFYKQCAIDNIIKELY